MRTKNRTASDGYAGVILQESIVPELSSRGNRRLEGPPAEVIRPTTRAGWIEAGHIVKIMVANAENRDNGMDSSDAIYRGRQG
jgi:hypothetical protein